MIQCFPLMDILIIRFCELYDFKLKLCEYLFIVDIFINLKMYYLQLDNLEKIISL